MLISNSHMQWVLLSAWYCSQLGYCLICWVWSCWAPLGTNRYIITNVLVACLALTRRLWPSVLPTVLIDSTTSHLDDSVLQFCSSLKILAAPCARCSLLTRWLGDCW